VLRPPVVAVMTLAGRMLRSSSTASRAAATLALMSSGVPTVSHCFVVVSRLTTVRCSSLAAGSATTRETAAANCHCSRTSLVYLWASTRTVVGYPDHGIRIGR
jgi:hypothetical protein